MQNTHLAKEYVKYFKTSITFTSHCCTAAQEQKNKMLTKAEYEDVRPQNIYTKQNKKKELEKECSSYHVGIHIPEHRKTPSELTITQ
jgi:hypothetical protein